MKKRLLSFTLLLLMMSSRLHAISVSPIRLEFGLKERVQTITVTSQAGKTYQVQVKRWTQVDGKDKLEDSNDLVISPTIFTVNAAKEGEGETKEGNQTVRVALKNPARENLERAYRLTFRELPQTLKEESSSTKVGAALDVLINMSVAVYVAPAVSSKGEIEWESSLDENSTLRITLHNQRNTRVIIGKLQIFGSGSGEKLFESVDQKPILAGQSATWSTKIKENLKNYQIKAVVNDDEKVFTIPLAAKNS